MPAGSRRESRKIINITVTTSETMAMTLVRGRKASLKKPDSTPNRTEFKFHVCHEPRLWANLVSFLGLHVLTSEMRRLAGPGSRVMLRIGKRAP